MNNSDLLKIKEVIKIQLETENNTIKDFYIVLFDELDKYHYLGLDDYKGIILYIKSFNLKDYDNYAKVFKKLLLIKMPIIKECEKNIGIAKEKRIVINKVEEIYNNINKNDLSPKKNKKLNNIYKKTKENIVLLHNNKSSVYNYDKIINKFNIKINKILSNSKIKKRIIITMLSVFIIGIMIGFGLIGSIPKLSYMSVKEYNKINSNNKISFHYNDNEIICTGITGLIFPFCFSVDEVEVYEKYKGNNVVGIAPKAFKESDIKSIILPEKLLYIGDEAFMYCRSLEKVSSGTEAHLIYDKLPDLYKIGKKAFYGCVNLFNLTLPGNVRYIGEDAFNLCGSNFILNYENSSRNWKIINSYDYDFNLICLSYTITIVGAYDYEKVIDVKNKENFTLGILPKKDGYNAVGYSYNGELISYFDGKSFNIFDFNKDITVYALYNKIGD